MATNGKNGVPRLIMIVKNRDGLTKNGVREQAGAQYKGHQYMLLCQAWKRTIKVSALTPTRGASVFRSRYGVGIL